MSILQPPSSPPRSSGSESDELDGLLHAFYRAEMPNPWPILNPLETRAVVPLQPVRRWPLQRSRWVLAASVALLLIGQLFLSGHSPDYSTARTGAVPNDVSARRDRPGTTPKRNVPAESKSRSSDQNEPRP